MNKERIISKWKTVWLPALALSLVFGVCGPIQLYLTNMQELWFTIKDIWWLCVGGGGILFLISAGIGMSLPQKTTRYYGAAVFGVALALYVQGNFIPTDYGVLDGGEIDWSAYRGTAVVNSLIWIACILVPLVLVWKKVSLGKQVVRMGALLVIAMQVVVVSSLLVTNQFGFKETKGYLTTKGIYDVSTEENVVVLILDTFDQQFFDEIYDKEPEFLEPLDGFTYFANTTSLFPTTQASVSYIMTGQPYLNQMPFDEYIDQAYSNTEYYDDLKADGFQASVYLDEIFVPTNAGDYFENFTSDEFKPSSYAGLMKTMYKFVEFRYFPHVLKKSVWFYGEEFDQWKQSSTDNQFEPASSDNLKFYNDLVEERLTLTDEKIYRLIHLRGVHLPYQLDENLNEVTDGSATYYTTSKAALKIAFEYIDQLKELGAYDNTTLVIMADHGRVNRETTAPAFLVKPQNARGQLEVNHAPVCHDDFMATIMTDLGLNEDHKYGRSAYEIPAEEQRERKFYFYSLDWEAEKGYMPQMVEYSVDASGNDLINFHLADYTVNQYELGETIELATSSSDYNGVDYCITGFDSGEKFTWTTTNQFVMGMELDGYSKGKNLVVTMEIESVSGGEQEVIILANNNDVYNGSVQSAGEMQYFIPGSVIEDNNRLELQYNLPNVISPADRGTSTDVRKLGLGISTVKIEETDMTEEEFLKESMKQYEYEIGTEVVFATDPDGMKYFTKGFSVPEKNYVWSSEAEGQMIFLLKGSHSGDLEMVLRFQNALTRDQQLIIKAGEEVLYNGAPAESGLEARFTIPESCIENDVLQLELYYPNAMTPGSVYEGNTDTRLLALAFSSMLIQQTQEQ